MFFLWGQELGLSNRSIIEALDMRLAKLPIKEILEVLNFRKYTQLKHGCEVSKWGNSPSLSPSPVGKII